MTAHARPPQPRHLSFKWPYFPGALGFVLSGSPVTARENLEQLALRRFGGSANFMLRWGLILDRLNGRRLTRQNR